MLAHVPFFAISTHNLTCLLKWFIVTWGNDWFFFKKNIQNSIFWRGRLVCRYCSILHHVFFILTLFAFFSNPGTYVCTVSLCMYRLFSWPILLNLLPSTVTMIRYLVLCGAVCIFFYAMMVADGSLSFLYLSYEALIFPFLFFWISHFPLSLYMPLYDISIFCHFFLYFLVSVYLSLLLPLFAQVCECT